MYTGNSLREVSKDMYVQQYAKTFFFALILFRGCTSDFYSRHTKIFHLTTLLPHEIWKPLFVIITVFCLTKFGFDKSSFNATFSAVQWCCSWGSCGQSFPLQLRNHREAGSGGSPPPTCSDLKIDKALCRVNLHDGDSPVAIKIWEISGPSPSERGDDSQATDAEVGNFSPGTRVLCNFIRC